MGEAGKAAVRRVQDLQGAYRVCEESLPLLVLTFSMRMLTQFEQLCSRGGFLMISQLVFIDYFEQQFPEF